MLFYISIGLVTFLWGLGFPTMKIGLGAMPPFTFLFLRSAVSTITIFSLMLIRNGPKLPPRGRPEFWWNALMHNLVFLLLYQGASITTAGRTSVFLYTQPLFYVALAAWYIPAERLGLRAVVGFFAAFGGIVVLFSEKFTGGGLHTLLGDFLVMMSALIWGLQSFYLRQNLKGIDPFRIAAWTQLIGAPIFLMMALVRDTSLPDFMDWRILIAVGYNGIIGTGLAMVLWVRLLAEFEPRRVSSFMFLTPVFGVFLSSLTLSEPLTGFMVSGASLVVAGIYLVNTDKGASMRVETATDK